MLWIYILFILNNLETITFQGPPSSPHRVTAAQRSRQTPENFKFQSKSQARGHKWLMGWQVITTYKVYSIHTFFIYICICHDCTGWSLSVTCPSQKSFIWIGQWAILQPRGLILLYYSYNLRFNFSFEIDYSTSEAESMLTS